MRALIPNVTKRRGAGIRAALTYDLNPSRSAPGRLISTNLLGRTIDELSVEIGRILAKRKVSTPILRISFSIPPGCRRTPEQWLEIIRRIAAECGIDLDLFPYTLVLHPIDGDSKEHVHFTLCRVGWDPSKLWVAPYRSYAMLQKICERCAKEFGWADEFSGIARPRDPDRDHAEGLRCILGTAVAQRWDFKKLIEELVAKGYGLVPNLAAGRLTGLSFVVPSGSMVKGSALGRSFGLKQLLLAGIQFDPDTDIALLKAARDQHRIQPAIQPKEQINGTALAHEQRRDGDDAFVERNSAPPGMDTPFSDRRVGGSDPRNCRETSLGETTGDASLHGRDRTAANREAASESCARHEPGQGGGAISQARELADHSDTVEGSETLVGIRTGTSRPFGRQSGVPGSHITKGGRERGRSLAGDLPIGGAAGDGASGIRGGLVLWGKRNLADALVSSGLLGIGYSAHQDATRFPSSGGNLEHCPTIQAVGVREPHRRRRNNERPSHSGGRSGPRIGVGGNGSLGNHRGSRRTR